MDICTKVQLEILFYFDKRKDDVMPINGLEITGGGLYLSDGTKFMELSNIDDVSMDITHEISDKEFCRFNNSKSCELTFDNSYVDEKLLNPSKFMFITSIPYAVQVRKHKKKRINKKWAKKYGYRLEFIEGKTKDATYNTQTGEFDFSYDDETIWQLYKHAADIFVYRVLSEIGYTDWK